MNTFIVSNDLDPDLVQTVCKVSISRRQKSLLARKELLNNNCIQCLFNTPTKRSNAQHLVEKQLLYEGNKKAGNFMQ